MKERIELDMEMTEAIFPPQLKNKSFKFVKLYAKSKIPIEHNWQNLSYSYEEVETWLKCGFNYGVQGGSGDLVIIDADTPEISQITRDALPDTFTVQSPRKGCHYYYLCKDIRKKIILKKEDVHYGEIISFGSQVVGPGSIHSDTGTEYKVINDVDIAEITRERIFSEFIEYVPVNVPQKDAEWEANEISIIDILNKRGLPSRKIGSQLVCGHPIHGSTNNNNFVVHPEKNVWHCFRCNTGGGALSLIAVLEGIIQCHEAVIGGLRGDKFYETVRIAKDKYGFDVKLKTANRAKVLLSEDKLTLLEAKIKAIPSTTPPVKIPGFLDPILKEIAVLNTAQADAVLKHTIKDHFGFTIEDLRGYEKVLRDYGKDSKNEEDGRPLSDAELIEMLHDNQDNKIIHPAQDYASDLMVFTVKVKDRTCLVTSDRQLFAIECAARKGLVVKHDTVDTARFSAKGISAFIESQYEIDISGLYEKIYGYIKRFIRFPDTSYLNYLTLWVMGTYVFMIFRYYPYVWLNAEKGSGKTLLMEILSAISFNGGLITNPTESVIFRDISNNLITMFIDEVEQLRKRDKDTYGSLISLLNAGFNKAGTVKRTESNGQGGFVLKEYTAYSPKMFAGISEIDDVLQDRTVRIPLLRKKDDEIVQRYKETAEIVDLQRSIRDDLYVFALTYARDIAGYYHKEGIDGIEGMSHLSNCREIDIWEPIFLLANVVDAKRGTDELTGMMEVLSKKSLEEKQSDNVLQNETCKILTVLKGMLDMITPLSEDGDVRVFSADRVLEYFKANEDFDWIQKTNILTRRLKKVRVASDQRRIEGEKKRVYIINVKEFTDLCERFKI